MVEISLLRPLIGLAKTVWSRIAVSADRRQADSRATFKSRLDLKNWIFSLGDEVQPLLPRTAPEERSEKDSYTEARDAFAKLDDDKILEVRHLFNDEIADRLEILCPQVYRHLRLINELCLTASLMAQSPRALPRDELLAQYSQSCKEVHAGFSELRDKMEEHLRTYR